MKTNQMFSRARNSGFSLVELIVVIAIMAILVGVAVPVFGSYVEKSKISKDIELVNEIADSIKLANNSGSLNFEIEGQYEAGLSKPIGYIIVSKGADLQTIMFEDGAEDILHQAIEDKFGEGYATELRLKYDGWNGDLGNFFESAPALVDKVEELGNNAVSLLNNNTLKKYMSGVFKDEHANATDLLLHTAQNIASLDKTQFINAWDSVNSAAPSFGLSGREYYSAARAAYNTCFSTYIRSFGASFTIEGENYLHSNYQSHAQAIADEGESAGELIAKNFTGATSGMKYEIAKGAVDLVLKAMDKPITFPQTVCDATLTGTTEDASKYTDCKACKVLLQEYKDSDRDKSDALNFYNTMTTGAVHGDDHTDDIFGWMKAEANSFADMNADINNLVSGKSAIVLTVYSKNRQIEVEYTPVLED